MLWDELPLGRDANRHEPPHACRDAKHVGVDGIVEPLHVVQQHARRGLVADAGERHEPGAEPFSVPLVQLGVDAFAQHLARELGLDPGEELEDVGGLDMVVRAVADRDLHRPRGLLAQLVPVGLVVGAGEEAEEVAVHDRAPLVPCVLGADEADDRTNQ